MSLTWVRTSFQSFQTTEMLVHVPKYFCIKIFKVTFEEEIKKQHTCLFLRNAWLNNNISVLQAILQPLEKNKVDL